MEMPLGSSVHEEPSSEDKENELLKIWLVLVEL